MKRLQLSQMVIGSVHCALCGIEARPPRQGAFGAGVAAFVRWYEEPTLHRQFGRQYEEHRRAVPAWCRGTSPGTRASASQVLPIADQGAMTNKQRRHERNRTWSG